MSSSGNKRPLLKRDMNSHNEEGEEELNTHMISNMLQRPVITGNVITKKQRIPDSSKVSETENLFISNLLVAFKTLELHLSLFKNTAAEISTSWKDIENSILSQRESFMKTSFKVTKEISLDDLACILHVVPEMYTCTYQKEPSIATIDPLTQLVPSNLFIETVDRFGSNLSEEDDTKRHVSSTLERRKSHFREKLFSLVKDSSQFTKLTHMNRTHLLSDSLVKFIDTSNSTSTKPGSTNTNPSSVGGVTGSVSSGMGLTQTTHESTSDTLAMKSTGSKSSGTGRAMNGSFYIPDAGIQSFGWSHNQLIDTLCHCTQIKPIEIASPVKNNSNSNPAGNGVAQSHDASKSNSHTHTDINSNDQSSHQSTLPVSPLPTSAIDSHSNNNSNEAFDMGTLRALAIERGKLQKTLQATLIRETEYQKQLSRLQSVIPIADEIQQIFNRLNRTSYVLIDIFQLLCNTALKRSQTEVSYIIQHILIKHTPEYFVIIARDNVCPQSSLHLNFNVKYSQIRSKLQSYVDSEKKDVLSKLQQLRLLSA